MEKMTKIRDNSQITIPKNIMDKLDLKKGDTISVELRDDEIVLKPVVIQGMVLPLFYILFSSIWKGCYDKNHELCFYFKFLNYSSWAYIQPLFICSL